MNKLILLAVSLVFSSSALAQWQNGVGFDVAHKAARFSNGTLPTGWNIYLTLRTPSFLDRSSDWFLNSGLLVGSGSAGMKTIEMNEQVSRSFDNCTVVHTLDMRLGRQFGDWRIFSEALGGHFRIHSNYSETIIHSPNNEKYHGDKVADHRLLRYGLGLGAGYQFSDNFKLELTARFTRGGAIGYVSEESVRSLEIGSTSFNNSVIRSNYSDLMTVGLTAVHTGWR